jgi:xanthine dehydrogenase YagS FAD-binding subunit
VRAFGYASPAGVPEALGLLREDAKALAGGTDLLTLMKSGVLSPARLVNVKGVLEEGISEGSGGLNIGALTRLSELERNRLLRERYTALAEAAAAAASPQLRNMATLGGNLLQRPRCWYLRDPQLACWLKGGEDCPAREGENRLHALFGGSHCVAVHPSDPAAALLALDASVSFRHLRKKPREDGEDGAQDGEGSLVEAEGRMGLQEFFALPEEGRRSENRLPKGALITSIAIPAPRAGTRSTYVKAMDRKAWAFALAGAAVAFCCPGRHVEDVRIVLSGVAPIPWRARAAERVLCGWDLSELRLERAAEAALEGAQPLEHNAYKVKLARTLVRRALKKVAGI